MSPRPFGRSAADSVVAAIRRVRVSIGGQIRDARIARRWTVQALADRAGVSQRTVYLVEAAESGSLDAAIRLGSALGLRLECEFSDPRRRRESCGQFVDPVHSAMGEFEAGHLRVLRYPVGVDEPYQHYQFAGRADVIAWDGPRGAFLHLENRTRFPDLQEMAGSFNAKRPYLGRAVADRLGRREWASETHVVVALWSAEVLHLLRRRPETFRAICPDSPAAFDGWWAGAPPPSGHSSSLVVLDPLATGRQRQYIGLEEAIDDARPRHRGYADAAAKLTRN